MNFDTIIDPLNNSIRRERPDIQSMHRIRGAAANFDSETREVVVDLVAQFDDATDNQSPEYALEIMTRMLGYLEGIRLQGSARSDEDDGSPSFSLAKDDKDRVIELCSQMRKIVFETTEFDQPHKRLLLNRIAAIEYQVEQPKGKLDVLRAGVSEVGETLGKFGTDIEPLTKRIKEVFQIGRSNSDEYAQIPAPDEIKRLPAPDDEAEE